LSRKRVLVVHCLCDGKLGPAGSTLMLQSLTEIGADRTGTG